MLQFEIRIAIHNSIYQDGILVFYAVFFCKLFVGFISPRNSRYNKPNNNNPKYNTHNFIF